MVVLVGCKYVSGHSLLGHSVALVVELFYTKNPRKYDFENHD